MSMFIPLYTEVGPGGKVSMGDNYPDGKDSTCPVCGKTMEKGYLISRGRIYWTNETPGILFQGEAMGPHSHNLRLPSSVEAYRCRRCRILRYEYMDRESQMVKLKCPYCGEWNEYYKKKSENDIRICQTCAKKF